MWIVTFALFASIFGASNTATTIHTKIQLNKNKAAVGETLEAQCIIRVTDRANDTRINVYWYRRVEGKDHLLGLNLQIYPHFPKERYPTNYEHLDSENKNAGVIFYLNITNLQVADTGDLGCGEVKTNSNQKIVFENFVVYRPPSLLEFRAIPRTPNASPIAYSQNRSLTTNETTYQRFSCITRGGYPKPIVSVMLDKTNITNKFQRRENLTTTGPTAGIQDLNYEIELFHDNFNLNYSFNNKSLKCVLNFPDTPMPKRTLHLNYSLLAYKPLFDCGERSMVVRAYENVTVSCKVHAYPAIIKDPTILVDMESNEGGRSYRLSEESKYLDLNLKVDVQTEMNNQSIMVMTLNIPRFHQHQLRGYLFIAENEVGQTNHSFEFILKDAVWGTANPTALSSILALVASCLLLAILTG